MITTAQTKAKPFPKSRERQPAPGPCRHCGVTLLATVLPAARPVLLPGPQGRPLSPAAQRRRTHLARRRRCSTDSLLIPSPEALPVSLHVAPERALKPLGNKPTTRKSLEIAFSAHFSPVPHLRPRRPPRPEPPGRLPRSVSKNHTFPVAVHHPVVAGPVQLRSSGQSFPAGQGQLQLQPAPGQRSPNPAGQPGAPLTRRNPSPPPSSPAG